jgi:hypothetical protein
MPVAAVAIAGLASAARSILAPPRLSSPPSARPSLWSLPSLAASRCRSPARCWERAALERWPVRLGRGIGQHRPVRQVGAVALTGVRISHGAVPERSSGRLGGPCVFSAVERAGQLVAIRTSTSRSAVELRAHLARYRHDRCLSRRMLVLVIQHHPHRAPTDLRRKLVRRLACHRSIFSGVGASDKPGAVHSRTRKSRREARHVSR